MTETKAATPAPAFDGATHRRGGVPVKVVQWAKDGDHPMVSRYPIERREFKGLLTVNAKEKFALRFGDHVIEDAEGRVWVEPGELPGVYVPIIEGVFVASVEEAA